MLSLESKQNFKNGYLRKIATDACLIGSMPTPNSPKCCPGLITARDVVPCTYTTSSGFSGIKSYPYSEYRSYQCTLDLRKERPRTVCAACDTFESTSLNQIRKLNRHSCEYSPIAFSGQYTQRPLQLQLQQEDKKCSSCSHHNVSNFPINPDDHSIRRYYNLNRHPQEIAHHLGIHNCYPDMFRRDRSSMVNTLASGPTSGHNSSLLDFPVSYHQSSNCIFTSSPNSVSSFSIASLSEHPNMSGIYDSSTQQPNISHLQFLTKKHNCHSVYLDHYPPHSGAPLPVNAGCFETYSDLLDEVHIK